MAASSSSVLVRHPPEGNGIALDELGEIISKATSARVEALVHAADVGLGGQAGGLGVTRRVIVSPDHDT